VKHEYRFVFGFVPRFGVVRKRLPGFVFEKVHERR